MATRTSPDTLELLGIGGSFQRELCAMLEDTHMFNDFGWQDIELLAGYMQAYRAPEGAVLFHEGDGGNYMCVLLEGRVDIYKEGSDAADRLVVCVERGKPLGEMAMVDGEPRSATAVAVSETLIALITKENFNRLTQEKPALAVKIMMKLARLLSQRLRRTSGILVDYLTD